ncbi:type IV toxin-antitoxin system AbiEi family antitoxin domain-containing protein [Ornithinimicrobium cryptoxanthini]|uniref:type IV toxin-antitoxin system AbiEi family antitoxin domain-containing protein n=1 Tax=Ornithinimicrobium cryptoxanthini TaxID=2934161 RepID=UPI0021183472|nr:type IV toxin-antitoxin system AbiEi family antitoxin domain-containing protein [Ornithinimicrobium cryptoxanthini]
MEPEVMSAVMRLANSQHGVISRAQALGRGMTPKQVFHAVHSGRWRRIQRGVYLTNSGKPDWHARAWAALLCAGTGAALSHSSAAYMWGLESKAPSMLRIAVPEGRTVVRPRGARIVRRRSLEVVERMGMCVTSVRQTVLDLTAQPGFTLDETSALLGRAAQRQLLKPDSLLKALEDYWHHPMADRLRRACADAVEGVESSLESRILRTVIRSHGLSGFALQVPLDVTRTSVAETDARPAGTMGTHSPAWPAITMGTPIPGAGTSRADTTNGPTERNDLRNVLLGIRVEGDGVEWHRDSFHEDRRRDRKAAAAGDLTVRVTWDAAEQPCEVALDLALTMTHRGWTGAPSACGPSCDLPQRWAALTRHIAS